MSKHNSACSHLEWMLRMHAIKGWMDIDDFRFEVTTADNKVHTWSTREVLSFYAGFCAGRTYAYELQENGCAYPSSSSPVAPAAGSSQLRSARLTPRRST